MKNGTTFCTGMPCRRQIHERQKFCAPLALGHESEWKIARNHWLVFHIGLMFWISWRMILRSMSGIHMQFTRNNSQLQRITTALMINTITPQQVFVTRDCQLIEADSGTVGPNMNIEWWYMALDASGVCSWRWLACGSQRLGLGLGGEAGAKGRFSLV